jgi:serine/threonine protein phosphatase 1
MPFLKDARGPEGLRLYATGDIHGRLDLLRATLARIAADLVRRPTPRFRLIFLGDHVDRGPDSAGVVDLLIDAASDGDGVCLAGNHDLWLTAFLVEPEEAGPSWLRWGGEETLASYGVDPSAPEWLGKPLGALRDAFAEALPADHRAFFASLSFAERQGDFLFVHAGVRPGVPIERQTKLDVTEIRSPFLEHEGDFGAVVVHGHTITAAPEVRPNRVGIDTGAYRTGRLTTFVVEGAEKGFLEPEGYVPLSPP